MRASRQVEPIAHPCLPRTPRKLFEGDARGIEIHQSDLVPLKKTRLGADNSIYLAELHLSGPEAVLLEHNALDPFLLRSGRLLGNHGGKREHANEK